MTAGLTLVNNTAVITVSLLSHHANTGQRLSTGFKGTHSVSSRLNRSSARRCWCPRSSIYCRKSPPFLPDLCTRSRRSQKSRDTAVATWTGFALQAVHGAASQTLQRYLDNSLDVHSMHAVMRQFRIALTRVKARAEPR